MNENIYQNIILHLKFIFEFYYVVEDVSIENLKWIRNLNARLKKHF